MRLTMRSTLGSITAPCLASTLSPAALAHTLAADESLTEQIGHQLSAAHHMPFTIAVATAAFAVVLAALRRYRRTRVR